MAGGDFECFLANATADLNLGEREAERPVSPDSESESTGSWVNGSRRSMCVVGGTELRWVFGFGRGESKDVIGGGEVERQAASSFFVSSINPLSMLSLLDNEDGIERDVCPSAGTSTCSGASACMKGMTLCLMNATKVATTRSTIAWLSHPACWIWRKLLRGREVIPIFARLYRATGMTLGASGLLGDSGICESYENR